MRDETLLFLHVLVAMGLLGGLLTASAAGFAARRSETASASLRAAAWWGALVAVIGAAGAIVLGEFLSSREDIGEPSWLNVSRILAILGLLAGGAVLAVVAGLARDRPRLTGWVGWLGTFLTAVALVVAFLMSAKPR